MKKISGLLLMGCSALALAGCGADDISSPGADSVDVDINNPAPTPTPTPGTGLVEAATDCPTTTATGGLALTNSGTITNAQGSWRVCTLPSLVNVSSTLPKVAGTVYRLDGRVDVGCDGGFAAPTSAGYTTLTVACASRRLTADTNVTLKIEPGVVVFGDSTNAASWLAVNRGNKLMAEGTEASPIIFTSRQNVEGTSTDNTNTGQWGGVVLLGRGEITDCDAGKGSTVSNNCERDTEGSADPAIFGGQDNTYNAGSLKYVQIRYSGYSLADGKELQSLTGGGIGTGTQLDYIQSFNSSDDGSEFFGGAVNLKHYVVVSADDDSLDLDTGVQANVQYVLIVQRTGANDSFFEIDSDGNASDDPRTKVTIANFTAIQAGSPSGNTSNQASMLFRGNSDVTLVNGVVWTPGNECLRMNGSAAPASPSTLNAYSVVMTCGGAAPFIGTGSYDAAAVKAQFDAGTNNNSAFTSTLANTFINGAGENAVPGYTSLATLSSFFTNTTYIGAVQNSSDTWYRGWTCNSAMANFGSTGACTALPTT